jgi:PAS domain S-box-containing protein
MPKGVSTVTKNSTATNNGMPQLVAQQAQANALFQSIGDGAIATDERGHIIRINQVALDLMGYQEEEVIDKWFPKIFVAKDSNGKLVNPLDRPATRAMLTGHAITDKTTYITKNKTLLPVSVTVSPILLEGSPIGAIEVFRDITHEQEVDRMKSEFISIASHQLRTPLTAIKTYTHLLSSGFRGNLNDEQQEFLGIIMGSVDRMNELINILLDISRIEEGKLQVVLKETKVKDLVENVIQELSQEASNKQIAIEFKCEDSPVIKLDRILTTEVLANLLSNAIKYTPVKGHIIVKIQSTPDEVLFRIKDNGYGIPPAEQTRVFSKFFRADNIKRREPSGTGLGLYMVKQIADNVGGHIEFISREGKGTTFLFTLPKNL